MQLTQDAAPRLRPGCTHDTATFLPALERLDPRFVAYAGDALAAWQQRLVAQLSVLGGDGDAFGADERHAIAIYGAGVAIGFHAIDDDRDLLLALPIPGPDSVWSAQQLRSVRAFGIAHGACVRDRFERAQLCGTRGTS